MLRSLIPPRLSRVVRFLIVLTLALLIAMPGAEAAYAKARAKNGNPYREAFALLDDGKAEAAMAIASRYRKSPLYKVVRASYMAAPGNDVSFQEMASFIDRNPAWPNIKGILMIAEQKMPASMSADQIVSWFAKHPPVTLSGFANAVEALNATGHGQNAGDLIRARWVEGDFAPNDLAAFYDSYGRSLGPDICWARMDRLTWKGDESGVRALSFCANEGMRATATARLALAQQRANAPALLANVPDEWRNDPGLIFERLRWHVRNDNDDDALPLLAQQSNAAAYQDKWWEQRNILARRMIERKDYARAYALAAQHGTNDSKQVTQAEFMAGWLALRFLNMPAEARGHFEVLTNAARTPVTRARGAYWLGRACEALGDAAATQQAYETAATFSATFYGQLAEARIAPNAQIRATPEPTIPAHFRADFYNRDNIRAIEALRNIGQSDRVRAFFRAASDAATQRAEFALLTEVAYRIDRPDLAIEAAKAANQKNILVTAGGFPLLDHHLPTRPDPAFTHAVIRQESMFNADAKSPAGARGLMQLMPGTAKGIAKKIGLNFKEKNLHDPEYNLKLGTSFIQHQLDAFDGSYILTLAGYNAGPRRVRDWMESIGDPRDPAVDPIDWIEMIPVYETRNYVQRILENLQIYRARLNGGQAKLQIMQDLRR
ncbi:MAG: lytic transglycosylase domain-containing protein [Bdellovibrionales bacterium]